MNYVELLVTAIQSLRSNILRTALTMLGIIIGIASVILIVALAQGATSSITSQVTSLGANLIIITPGQSQRGPAQSGQIVTTLTYEDSLAIKNLNHIAAVSAVVQRQLQVVGNGENTNVTVQGVSFGYQTVQSIDIDKGQFISEEDESGLSKVAVLGPDVVKDLFGEDANPVGQLVTIGGRSFTVIGVTKAKGSSGFSNPDQMVYIPVTTAMKIVTGQTYVNVIQAVADDSSQVDPMMSEIKTLLLDRHGITDEKLADFTVRSSKEFLSTLNTVTGILTAMLAGIAGISLVVGGIGIMNIMLVTVTERTKEIGLLKSIGAKRSDILVQFLIESVVVTLAGGLVGIILGETLAFLLARVLGLPYVFQLQSILLAVGVSTVVGIVFGLYPAQRAARLSPIDALRYE